MSDATGRHRFGKAAGLICSVYGVILAIGAASGSVDPIRPLGALARTATPSEAIGKEAFASAGDSATLASKISAADGKPSLVYVTADWCVSCTVIDRNVLIDPSVRSRLAHFNLVKIDVSDNTPIQQGLIGSLRVVGPPTMIFIDPAKREIAGSRLVGEVSIETLLASLGKAESDR